MGLSRQSIVLVLTTKQEPNDTQKKNKITNPMTNLPELRKLTKRN